MQTFWATMARRHRFFVPILGLFLHGPSLDADVQVVWRSDINADVLDTEAARRSLELCPPSALEALPLPVWAVRRWLSDDGEQAAIADVPEKSTDAERGGPLKGSDKLRRDDEEWTSIYPAQMRPGDTSLYQRSTGAVTRSAGTRTGEILSPTLVCGRTIFSGRKAPFELRGYARECFGVLSPSRTTRSAIGLG